VPVEGKPVGALTSQAIAKDSLLGNNTQIRRLTPIECERLQGLPDNYTSGVSNSQRYKMLGNGWTIDVIAHILSFAKF
jgi:DNA (cytosine-5)-methyltransferase 3A